MHFFQIGSMNCLLLLFYFFSSFFFFTNFFFFVDNSSSLNLWGSIPTEIGRLKNLKALYAFLSYSILLFFFIETSLFFFHYSFPIFFFFLFRLIFNTKLNGTLPTEIGDLSALGSLLALFFLSFFLFSFFFLP